VDSRHEITLMRGDDGFRDRCDVGGESAKTARAISNTGPRTKDEGRALRVHGAGELEHCHRVLRRIFDAFPYLARQLSMFYRLPTEGYA
jgi:hypothetical protein